VVSEHRRQWNNNNNNNVANCELVPHPGLVVDDTLLGSFSRVEPSDATLLGASLFPGSLERLLVGRLKMHDLKM